MSSDSAHDPQLETAADRAARFASGPPKLSPKVIWLGIGALALLGLGGAFADHSFNVSPAPTSTPQHAARFSSSLDAFLGLTKLSSSAPPIDLETTTGKAFSLDALAGRVVIVSFLPPACAETCPVVSQELALAARRLDAHHVHAVIAVVNVDPADLFPRSVSGVLSRLPSSVFLTGSLNLLQPVWRTYGVTIDLDPNTGALAYTSTIDLIDPHGRLRYSMTPFANESRSGAVSLPRAQISRYGAGIATYAQRIAA